MHLILALGPMNSSFLGLLGLSSLSSQIRGHRALSGSPRPAPRPADSRNASCQAHLLCLLLLRTTLCCLNSSVLVTLALYICSVFKKLVSDGRINPGTVTPSLGRWQKPLLLRTSRLLKSPTPSAGSPGVWKPFPAALHCCDLTNRVVSSHGRDSCPMCSAWTVSPSCPAFIFF